MGKISLRRHRDCLPVRIKWNLFIFMILSSALSSSYGRASESYLQKEQVQTDTPGQRMGPRPKRPPSSINFRRFSIYCFDSVLHKLKRHKFGKSRTIITMRVSLADNFGILFRIVNAQNNFVQYIYIYFFFYKYYLVQS